MSASPERSLSENGRYDSSNGAHADGEEHAKMRAALFFLVYDYVLYLRTLTWLQLIFNQ
jgi:hypothetical protein